VYCCENGIEIMNPENEKAKGELRERKNDKNAKRRRKIKARINGKYPRFP
jgi:hypothetical protein